MTELLSRNHCKRSKIMSKGSMWAKAHNDWTIELWNKVLWTDESKFEISWSNRRAYVRRTVGERAATPCITQTIKDGRGSVMVCVCVCVGGLLLIAKSGICTWWMANWIRLAITAYCNIIWFHLEWGLWVKDFYSCKIMSKLCQRYITSKREQVLQLMS